MIQSIINTISLNFERYKFKNSLYIGETFYTYQQLSEKVASIRNQIKDLNCLNSNFGLIDNADFETYASIIAVWMEGGAYIPINSKQPIDRTLDIIEQCEIQIVLCSKSSSNFSKIHLVDTSKFIDSCENLDIIERSIDSNAYILFTSGSSGKPKGVPISFKNLISFVNSFENLGFNLNYEDRFLQPFDLSFDLSVISFLIPLLKGACVYVVPNSSSKYIDVVELLEEHELTFALMVPSTIQFLKPYFSEIILPKLKYSLFCGEALFSELALEWKKCIPSGQIYNVYGPTEHTIFCTSYCLGNKENVKDFQAILSIGKPMDETKMIIIDESGTLCDANIKGELCLSGAQLTSGYLNNLEKNQESFFVDSNNERYYKTGDICFKDTDGDYFFVGRKDNQVKIQGYRIELGEIEFHAKEILKGINVIVSTFEHITGNAELIIFIEGKEFNTIDFFNQIKEKIPSYMIPHKSLFIGQFPLNSNGKIDRNKLKLITQI